MSQTTTITEGQKGLRTVTLNTGSVYTFNSNESTTLEKIPIIDASRIWSEKLEDRQAVAEEIREASRNIGFFYLINHVSIADRKGFFESHADLVSLGHRSKIRGRSHGPGQAFLCAAGAEEDGGLHGTGAQRVRRLPSDGVLQPKWVEVSR